MTLRVGSANRDLLRRMNASSVLGIVHDHGPIARTDIAARSGLSLATISNITGSLIEQGIVVEQSVGASRGGRRPILLDIDRAGALAFGIKLTDGQVIVAITDLGASLVDLRTAPLPDNPTPADVADQLVSVVTELRALYQGRRFIGLGLGMAGIIDRAGGICRYSPFLSWRDAPLRALLHDRLELPVIIENDVNALTVAERWFGAGSDSRNFLVVTIGRGVGMGIIADGELYRGGRDGAGEFGHVTVVENGRRCNCGKAGCVEAYLSEPALAHAVRTAAGAELSLEAAVDRANDDAQVAAVFANAGHLFGLALAGVVNVLNPTLLILSGEGARWIEPLMPALRETLAAHCFDHFFDDLQIDVEPWGDDAWARGAAALVLDEFFHPADVRTGGGALTHPAPVAREAIRR